MSTRSMIQEQFEQVAREQGLTLAPVSEDTMLLETGLDSLCFAIIVARLEDNLGIDPFQTIEDDGFPVTFGELVRLYERAAD